MQTLAGDADAMAASAVDFDQAVAMRKSGISCTSLRPMPMPPKTAMRMKADNFVIASRDGTLREFQTGRKTSYIV